MCVSVPSLWNNPFGLASCQSVSQSVGRWVGQSVSQSGVQETTGSSDSALLGGLQESLPLTGTVPPSPWHQLQVPKPTARWHTEAWCVGRTGLGRVVDDELRSERLKPGKRERCGTAGPSTCRQNDDSAKNSPEAEIKLFNGWTIDALLISSHFPSSKLYFLLSKNTKIPVLSQLTLFILFPWTPPPPPPPVVPWGPSPLPLHTHHPRRNQVGSEGREGHHWEAEGEEAGSHHLPAGPGFSQRNR